MRMYRGLVAILALVLVGCPARQADMPGTVVSPGFVGQIVAYEQDPTTSTYTLELLGSTVEVPEAEAALYGRPVDEGLVLLDSDDEPQWYAVLTAADDGCFALQNGSAINEGPAIVFPMNAEVGLRLEKSAAWSEPEEVPEGQHYSVSLSSWCVDEDGQVESADYGAP